MRNKILAVAALAAVLFFNADTREGFCGTVKMRIVVVNPSSSKVQTKTVKNYLPKEVILKDILDTGGLEIDYDQEQGMLFATKKDVELAAGETKIFELVMDDVWVVAEQKLDSLRKRTEGIVEKLKSTSFYEQAEVFAKTIYGRLEEIAKSQNDENATRQQHIAYYRDNLMTLLSIQADMDKLEKLVVTAGGTPTLDVIEESDVDLKAPSSKTTWVLILIILLFIAVLGVAFYFTWQGQAKVTQNIFTREKDASFTEFQSHPPSDEVPLKETEKKSP